MTNFSAFIISIVGLIICSFLVIFAYKYNKRGSQNFHGGFFIMMCLCGIEWFLCEALFYIVINDEVAMFIYSLKFIGISFLPVFYLFSILTVLGKNDITTKKNFILLIIIPVITVILSVTNDYHNLFRESYELITSSHRIVIPKNGAWFYVHIVFSFSLSILGIVFLIYQYKNAAIRFKFRIGVVLSAAVLTPIGNIIHMVNFFNDSYDVTLITMVVSFSIYFWSMYYFRNSSFIGLARDRVFKGLPYPLFILDNTGTIVDINDNVINISNFHITMDKSITFENWLVDWVEHIGGMIELQDGVRYIHYYQNEEERYYRITSSPLLNGSDTQIGEYVALDDLTRERILLNAVDAMAKTDGMTKLFNRNSYEMKLSKIDAPKFLTTGIIIGDVNDLKLMNDLHGHKGGDELLITVAEILTKNSPEGGFVARIGGDEYVIILTRTTSEIVENIVANIKTDCHNHPKINNIEVSIALGYATRDDIKKSLSETVAEADAKMYENKALIKSLKKTQFLL